MAYNDLDTKVSQNKWVKSDADEGWEYKVNLGPEKVIDQRTGAKIRVATVSVRRIGDEIERFQIKTSFSPKSNSTSLGTFEQLPKDGIAKTDGFLTLTCYATMGGERGSYQSYQVVIDGKYIANASGSDGGGWGVTNNVTTPIKKGSRFWMNGCFGYFIPLNKS